MSLHLGDDYRTRQRAKTDPPELAVYIAAERLVHGYFSIEITKLYCQELKKRGLGQQLEEAIVAARIRRRLGIGREE